MGYRVLFLTNPAKLSVKNEQLIVDTGEQRKIPLEDIECIAIDNLQINLSAYLLMKLSEYGITFYVPDRSHHPCGVFLPICVHSRHMAMLQKQIDMTQPAKKQLWRQIVKQKIHNQAEALRLCGVDGWQAIDELKHKVTSGDSNNMEAVAAAQYFKLMFGRDFTRSQENVLNACLNYGYAIMRSTIEKYLIIYGYEPSLGIFHKSTLNSFNLADDIIEAYRPVVDMFVKLYAEDIEEIDTYIKARLVNLLSADVIIEDKLYACARAIELTVQSLTGYFNGKRKDLALPDVMTLEQHEYE